MNETSQLKWEPVAQQKYDRMIRKIPLFHRQIAQELVEKKALDNARVRGSHTVEEGDILRAFFSEVPMAFYSLMIRLFEEVGFDYQTHEPK